MKTLYLAVLLLFTLSVFAQKSYKVLNDEVFSGMGAKAQNEIDANLDKAREQFLKIISKEPNDAMAHFGLSVVYSYDKYTRKDYFEAWKYFKFAEANIALFTDDDKEVLNLYFPKVDLKRRNRPLDKNMEWERGNVEDKLIKFVREENKLEYANKFITEFPDSRYIENVTHIRNYIEYRTAENTNTVQAFNDFLKKYPEAAQVSAAIAKRNALAYNDALTKNTLAALKGFTNQYPDAVQVEDAKKIMGVLAYEEAAKSRKLEIIDQYMQEYPNSSKMPEAKLLKRQLLFEWAKSVNTLDAYNKFVALYPEGELYIDIFNMKANALGQSVVMDFPMENYKFIKGFDNQNMNDFGGDVAIRPNGDILVLANTKKGEGEMNDAWFLGLNSEGKMLYNNILGNEYDDQVNRIELTPKNEVYVAGITNAVIGSVPGKAWLFKMGADGKNIYNNKLEGNEVKDLAIYNDGKALLCGDVYNETDSTVEPFLIRVNENGKKLWSRTYSQGGSIYGLALNKNNMAYIANDTWYFAIDENGYLKWDKIVASEIKITAVNIAANGNIVFAGLKGLEGYVLACDTQGNTLWETTFDAKNLTFVKIITPLADNSVLCSGTSADDKVIIVKIDGTGKTAPAKVFSLPGGLILNGIAPAEGNFAIISATRLSPKQDLLVFKLGF
jgi:outer membrane protein assembly factor BamD (BamD/ComL family)